MKKIFAAIIFVFICYTSSFAAFFIDGYGANIDAGDLKNQTGLGFALGFGITPNINFKFASTMTDYTENANKPDEINYEHLTFLGGIEFIPYFPQLEAYRIQWRSSLLVGAGKSSVELKTGEEVSDMGTVISFWTGLQYDLTQTISPYLEIGYHKASYTHDFEKASVGGYQIAIGVRFYVFGNKDYTSEYQ